MKVGQFTLLLANALTVLIPMILSLTVHEFAHGFAAKKLGDNTAEVMGRLNLNPLSHADLFGTIILPLVILMAGGMGMGVPFFGWAKPVPFNAGRFRRTISVRRGTTIVAAAGPLSNLMLAFICAGLMSLPLHTGVAAALEGYMPPYFTLLKMMVMINIALFVFNLIPIYPLDGQKVLSGFLPPSEAMRFERFNQQFGTMMLWMLILFARNIIAVPVNMVAHGVLTAVGLG